VVIAYIEAGINWHHGDAQELANKVYLNRGELPPPLCDRSPCVNPGSYDANGDGVFNAADYADDSRVGDFNGNGVIDPEDVITAFTCYDRTTGSVGQLSFDAGNRQHCSNGDAVLSVDNDGNGYPHDISGWDFYDHQNDPATYDTATPTISRNRPPPRPTTASRAPASAPAACCYRSRRAPRRSTATTTSPRRGCSRSTRARASSPR